MPASWSYQTFWQYADHGTQPGDQDAFNGDAQQLAVFASGSRSPVTSTLAPSVTVLESNTANCAGTAQYFADTDTTGVPIDWTNSNGTHACVRVRYSPAPTAASCAYAFYVPSGDATGVIVFGYWTADGVKHYVSLDENPVSGWQTLFRSAQVNRIEFQDNNGQSGTRIGWGRLADHGVRQSC